MKKKKMTVDTKNLKEEKIIKKDIINIQKDNIIDYSFSINLGRSIPNLNDGLKPVQRRILYSLYESGNTSNKPTKKCNTQVGLAMRYSPHGDASIYSALIRMSQNFNNNIPLIKTQGNNGDVVSPDSYAASRYLECKLDKFSENYLLDNLKENSVDFIPNYDQSTKEPVVLPSKINLLLMNGATGIGSCGYSSFILPNNPIQVAKETINLIKDSSISVEDVAKSIQPDFPTGGYISSQKDIIKAYSTGRGTITNRSKIEQIEKGNKNYLVITETPYLLAVENLIDSIIEKSRPTKENPNPPITEIHDISNQCNRGKIKVVIELNKNANPSVVENKLYKYTKCQVVQKIILVATENFNSFKQYNIKELMLNWIDFRRITLKRIFTNKIKNYHYKMHIIEGLLIALKNIDRVIEIIKKSKDINSAKNSLIKEFKLSEIQAQAIVDMKLGKLTSLEINKLVDEKNDLKNKIEELIPYIKDTKNIDKVIISEQEEFIDKFSKIYQRKTKITNLSSDVDTDDVIDDEDFLVILTKDNYLKKIPCEIKSQKRNTHGINTGKIRDNDKVISITKLNSKDNVLLFTDTGKVYCYKCYQFEKTNLNSFGNNIGSMVKGEKIINLIGLTNDELKNKDNCLMIATKGNKIKLVQLTEFSRLSGSGIIATKLNDNDKVISVELVNLKEDKDCSIFAATDAGTGIRFSISDIPIIARTTFGTSIFMPKVAKEGKEVVSVFVVRQEDLGIILINKSGLGKRVLIEKFDIHKRCTIGKTIIRFKNENDKLVSAIPYTKEDKNIIMISNKKIVSIKIDEIPTSLCPAYGSHLKKLNEKEYIVDFTIN